MAGSRSYFARASYRFMPTDRDGPIGSDFELEESEIWNPASAGSASPEMRKPAAPSSRFTRKSSTAAVVKRAESGGERVGGTPASLPVNIPDWSKILKEDCRENRRDRDPGFFDDDDQEEEGDGESGGNRIPPHEFLARQFPRARIASFSVHEGIGRTLKGRDLSRVRNAIWEKIGFQD